MQTAAKPADVAPVKVTLAEFEAGATTLAALPRATVPEVAFAGRSNVGKSSLMNALVQRKGLVRTSSTPGCTRQINLFAISTQKRNATPEYRLVDLPGYGYAKLSKAEKAKWGAMIEGYLTERATLRVVVLLVDIRRGFEEDDGQLADFVTSCREGTGLPPLSVIVAATKLDKIALAKRKPALSALQRAMKGTGGVPVGFSAVTGEGRDLLWTRLMRSLAESTREST